jgi:hypothetical protein
MPLPDDLQWMEHYHGGEHGEGKHSMCLDVPGLIELSKDSSTGVKLTAHGLLETNTFPEDLEEVLADLWGEDGRVLFLN